MALYKSIRQSDGVTTNYHRILFLTQTVNRQNSIAILSYVDEEARREELSGEYDVYKRIITYETNYDETMTVESAYEYLKTLDRFNGAEDV